LGFFDAYTENPSEIWHTVAPVDEVLSGIPKTIVFRMHWRAMIGCHPLVRANHAKVEKGCPSTPASPPTVRAPRTGWVNFVALSHGTAGLSFRSTSITVSAAPRV